MLGFDEFELDLAQSLLQQLPPKFANLAPAALTNTNTQTIPDKAQGAYLLFQKGVLVYVGKSDAEMGLRRRLERHSSKIQQRKNLVPADIEYKALSIFSFHVMDAETLLIKHYSSTLGTRPAWNDSGFGANDPGRERDTTKVSRFDSMY